MTTPRRAWRRGLVVVVALLYVWIGLAAGGLVAVAGVGGAILIVAALALPHLSRPVAVALLLAGVLPLPALTWWSLVTPLLAVLCLALALARPHAGTSRR